MHGGDPPTMACSPAAPGIRLSVLLPEVSIFPPCLGGPLRLFGLTPTVMKGLSGGSKRCVTAAAPVVWPYLLELWGCVPPKLTILSEKETCWKHIRSSQELSMGKLEI